MNFLFKVANAKLKKEEIGLFWLGQAGFLLKDFDGNIIVIDPYLTDCGERIKGFKRLSPKIISPSELEPDIYITTHIHFDHFDVDAIPIVSASHETKFFGPKSCIDKFVQIGIKPERLKLLEQNKALYYKDIMIKAVFADHGELAPDAIGLIMNIKGIKIYFSGDTAYCPDKMDEIIKFNPDIAVLSVNGRFGNLNSEEGAKVARDINAKIAIPCHFWTFREHGGDPLLFEQEMKKNASECRVKFMYQGEIYRYSKIYKDV